jgi:hypothetical protein
MIKNSHETAVEHLYLEFFGKRKIPRLMVNEKGESPLEVALQRIPYVVESKNQSVS